jgi:adenosylcobyric acid synthase
MKPAIMVQGTGSNVGKTIIVAGLCRLLKNRGYNVYPFKPQNMSNNAYVTADGGEIGRAQALQAQACRVEPSVHMNPVLLKPEAMGGAQIVVQGKHTQTVSAREYTEKKGKLLSRVAESFHYLEEQADIIIAEGAGSPAEMNLRCDDIANMGFAHAVGMPVLLVGDIDRGGIIAQICGTYDILPLDDRQHIKGYIINKFRGDVTLFNDGLEIIGQHTGLPSLGILPWIEETDILPKEDTASFVREKKSKKSTEIQIRIAVLKFPRIANFDDFDPLSNDPCVDFLMVHAGEIIPFDADLVILPGSKSTVHDLAFLREQAWDVDLRAYIRRGGKILGLCGGYQMLGHIIRDTEQGRVCNALGLGLLDIETVMLPEKTVSRVSGYDLASSVRVEGYEIHMGITKGSDCARAWLCVNGENDGAMNKAGSVMGCYMHGLFTQDSFRKVFYERIVGDSFQNSKNEPLLFSYLSSVEQVIDTLAEKMEACLNINCILDFANKRFQ